MDKEAVEHMHETLQSSGRLADRVNCPHMERKGDTQYPGKYRGITLLGHIMKLPERILDKRLHEKV